nr:hypothetical protein [Paraburkholderia sp. BL8N3]
MELSVHCEPGAAGPGGPQRGAAGTNCCWNEKPVNEAARLSNVNFANVHARIGQSFDFIAEAQGIATLFR